MSCYSCLVLYLNGQTKIENFSKIVKGLKLLTIFAKYFFLNVSQDSEYTYKVLLHILIIKDLTKIPEIEKNKKKTKTKKQTKNNNKEKKERNCLDLSNTGS